MINIKVAGIPFFVDSAVKVRNVMRPFLFCIKIQACDWVFDCAKQFTRIKAFSYDTKRLSRLFQIKVSPNKSTFALAKVFFI